MQLRFLRTIFLLTVLLAVVLAYPMYAWFNPEIVRAIVASGIIALVNVILGYFALEFSIDKNTTIFMGVVFGGMGVRMGLVLLTIAILVKMGYHPGGLVLSFMGAYVVFMIAEITYVARNLSQRGKAEKRARQSASGSHSLRTISLEQVRN